MLPNYRKKIILEKVAAKTTHHSWEAARKADRKTRRVSTSERMRRTVEERNPLVSGDHLSAFKKILKGEGKKVKLRGDNTSPHYKGETERWKRGNPKAGQGIVHSETGRQGIWHGGARVWRSRLTPAERLSMGVRGKKLSKRDKKLTDYFRTENI